MHNLDETDLQMLRILQEDCTLTIKELAQRVNKSNTPVFERLNRIQKAGYIKRKVAVLDAEQLDCGFVVFCQVKLQQMNKDMADQLTDAIESIPEVVECYNVSGEYDYLLKIRVKDMKSYRQFIMDKLGTLPNIGSIQSVFVMNELKQSYGLPI